MMYTRLTPLARSLRNGAFKVIGWTLASATVAGGAVTAQRIVAPTIANWFSSQPSLPPPAMAMTPRPIFHPSIVEAAPSVPAVASFIAPPASTYQPAPNYPRYYSPQHIETYHPPLIIEQPRYEAVPEVKSDDRQNPPPAKHVHIGQNGSQQEPATGKKSGPTEKHPKPAAKTPSPSSKKK